jgi:predicted membrane GTPase involved in stress response
MANLPCHDHYTAEPLDSRLEAEVMALSISCSRAIAMEALYMTGRGRMQMSICKINQIRRGRNHIVSLGF